jgi:pullulanase
MITLKTNKLKAMLVAFSVAALAACSNNEMDTSKEKSIPAVEENLWLDYNENRTIFKLWNPEAELVTLQLYDNGTDGSPINQYELNKQNNGVWIKEIEGDLNGTYYTYQVTFNGKKLDETPGIYAKAVGVNGKRAMVLNFDTTNPENWQNTKGPSTEKPNKAIIYELHVRDLSIHPNSGITNKGKFLGLAERGTKTLDGITTGLDHILDLGVTHIHLLPSYDYGSVDESKLDQPQFNWGYDPVNYNVPEGSYSTNPFNAEVRVKEFKSMVKSLHDNNLGVILDVVYNHTFNIDDSPFSLEYPEYYYRQWEDGSYSNASGCGNETASEKPMMRKYIIESCKHWMNEYKLDGFRFDLMGIHDIETMNMLADELRKINPEVIIYGEGWTAEDSPLPFEKRAVKAHTNQMPYIAAFSDDIRDGIKGSVFEGAEPGFVNGASGLEESIKFGVVGSTQHPQINYEKVNYSNEPWANEPWQAVNYVSCHDNYTLFDKLIISAPKASAAEIEKMHCLANAIVLTSQGVPFLHAGVEMMRTKGGEHNSYNLPDVVNQFVWERKKDKESVHNYYKSLIELRKMHPAFSLGSTQQIQKHLEFIIDEPKTVGFRLNNVGELDSWNNIIVIYHAGASAKEFNVEGEWNVAASGMEINANGLGKKISGKVSVEPISMTVLYN